MDRFFVAEGSWGRSKAVLSIEESHHCVRVMRKSAGDKIEVFDGAGRWARGVIAEGSDREVTVLVEEEVAPEVDAVLDALQLGKVALEPDGLPAHECGHVAVVVPSMARAVRQHGKQEVHLARRKRVAGGLVQGPVRVPRSVREHARRPVSSSRCVGGLPDGTTSRSH